MKEIGMKNAFAVHLETGSGLFSNGLCKDVQNKNETHFLLNMDDGRNFGFAGETEIRYDDVVSRGEGLS